MEFLEGIENWSTALLSCDVSPLSFQCTRSVTDFHTSPVLSCFSRQKRATSRSVPHHPLVPWNVPVCGTQRLIGLRLSSASGLIQEKSGIPSLIAAGPKSFLKVEYVYFAAYIVVLSGDLLVATEEETTGSFIVGTLMLCGTIQLVTDKWRAKTTHQQWMNQGSLDMAIQGFSVDGLTLVPIGGLALFVLKNLPSLLHEIFWTSFRHLFVDCVPRRSCRSQCACPFAQDVCSSSALDSF